MSFSLENHIKRWITDFCLKKSTMFNYSHNFNCKIYNFQYTHSTTHHFYVLEWDSGVFCLWLSCPLKLAFAVNNVENSAQKATLAFFFFVITTYPFKVPFAAICISTSLSLWKAAFSKRQDTLLLTLHYSSLGQLSWIVVSILWLLFLPCLSLYVNLSNLFTFVCDVF